MILPTLHYSAEEHARRGTEMYESQIRPLVEEGNYGKIVSIDIDSGAYEIARDTVTASDRLIERYPNAQIWCVRVGHKGVHKFGLGRPV
ncbi:MAG: hypothetical protein AAFQ95_12920 [Cyanobacteria bacterium J06621_3]